MKSRIFIILSTVLIGSILFCLWLAFVPRDEIEWHRRAWLNEYKEVRRQQTAGGSRLSVWEELKRTIGRREDPHQQMREHERALLSLGYLTNYDLRVTNQVLTREFSSNFIHRLCERFGTNDCIWLLRGSTNRDAYFATLPAKDVSEWERIFRECAMRYASNIPPSLSTNAALP